MRDFRLWRPLFILTAMFILVGGPQHPDGTLAEMLGHPTWVCAHSLLLAGFVALLVGLFFFRSNPTLPPATRRWTRFAVIGTGLQTVEMVLHTAAVVDHSNLVAGNATPVLTTHLAAAVVLHPIFAATFVGLIIVAARDGVLGSRWISWIGIVGLVAHGIAPALVGSGIEGADVLFPLLMLFAVWLLLAGFLAFRRASQDSVGRAETGA